MERNIIKNPSGSGFVVKQVRTDGSIILTAQTFKKRDSAQAWIEEQERMENIVEGQK